MRRSSSRSTSDAGFERDPRGELLHQSPRTSVGLGLRLALEVPATRVAQRLEGLELAEILRELVVDSGSDALGIASPSRHTRRGVRHLLDGVVGGIVGREVFSRPPRDPSSWSSNPGGFAFAPISTDIVVLVVASRFLAGRPSASARRSVERRPCRRRSMPRSFDRLVARRAVAQLRQRLLHGALLDVHRGPAQRMYRSRPGRWRRSRSRGERQRLPSSTDDVADVGRVHRLDAALAQRLVDRARDQIVRDVVKDLLAEALLDDVGRRLARAEPGNARLRL